MSPRDGATPVAVGVIAGAYGVDGAVWVKPLSDAPGRERTLADAVLTREGQPARPVRVSSARSVDGRWLVSFEGVATREDAQALLGFSIMIEVVERPPLPDGRIWVSDLVGRPVITEDGASLGTLTGVIPRAGNDLFVIETERGELLFPALKDLVRDLPPSGAITVRLIPGLLDACLTPKAS